MIITKQKNLDKLCADLANNPFFTIDTEFIREKTYYPNLCLIQVSDPEKNAKAIDPLAGDLDLKPLYELLFDQDILKVFHAGRQDLEIFHDQTRKVVKPFFDTQIAAMVCGYGDSVGYASLVQKITGHRIDKSTQFTNWARRPLSQKQIDYALSDVTHLIDIYNTLSAELEEKGRTDWVFEEEEILADPETYKNPPEEAWKRIKIRHPKAQTLAVLKELAAWRERRAREKNIPRSWVLKDKTLAALSTQMPGDQKALSKTRNMPGDLAKGQTGEEILQLIEKAKNSDKGSWPSPGKRKSLPPHAGNLIDSLKLLLKIQCAQQGVATKLVASKQDLEDFVINHSGEIPLMKGWRYQVFGQYAMELKKGRLALGYKNGKIVKYKITNLTHRFEE